MKRWFGKIIDDLLVDTINIEDKAAFDAKMIGLPGLFGLVMALCCAFLTGMAFANILDHAGFWAFFAVIAGFGAFFMVTATAVNWVTWEVKLALLAISRQIAGQGNGRGKG